MFGRAGAAALLLLVAILAGCAGTGEQVPTTRLPPDQNAFSTAPMIAQPTTLFTPSISVSMGFRIAKA